MKEGSKQASKQQARIIKPQIAAVLIDKRLDVIMSSRRHSTSKHERHGSSGSKSHKSKDSVPSGSRSSRSDRISLSFLFVVNDLNYDFYDEHEPRDQYQNRLPPGEPRYYVPETPSRVLRYRDGAVSQAHGYQWMPSNAETGERSLFSNIIADENGRRMFGSEYDYWLVPEYKRCAVFACNPLLPIMVSREDPMVHVTTNGWELLQVFHPPHLGGITQVAFEDADLGAGGGLVRYVAGTNPTWMPALLPTTYQRPASLQGPASRGLGGDLAIILGLMALNERAGCRDNAFLERNWWYGGQWHSNAAPRGHPRTARSPPSGVLSAVFYDPENPAGSNKEWLETFEWDGPIVIG